jgi:hypothetical protein
VLRSLRVGRDRPTAHEFAQFRATLVKKGFSRQIVAIDHKLSITNSDIDYDREVARLTVTPSRESAAKSLAPRLWPTELAKKPRSSGYSPKKPEGASAYTY